MSTYLEICQSVRAQAGIAGSGPSNVQNQVGIYANVVRWVDEAYNEIQTLHPNWNFLYSQRTLTFPSGFNSYPVLLSEGLREIANDSYVWQFQLGRKTRLEYLPWHIYKNADRFLEDETGSPEVITADPSGNLVIWPTPDEDYQITFEGFIVPDVMDISSDIPIIPAQYHDLIKLKALMKYSENFTADTVYRSADTNFRLMLRKMQFSELPRDNLVQPRFVPFA